jgi:hypothetical protein
VDGAAQDLENLYHPSFEQPWLLDWQTLSAKPITILSGPNVIKLFMTQLTNVSNKLEYGVRPEAYPRVEHLQESLLG